MNEAQLREAIRSRIRQVPKAHSRWSIQMVRDFKKTVAEAEKAIRGRSTLPALQSAFNNIERFFKEQ